MAFKLTAGSLKELCRQHKLYTSRPELNDVLYLQCKGIERIESLEAYTGLKTLYLDSNAISVIEGLEQLVELRCLYLAKNLIHHIEGLQTLRLLETIDLSDNDIHQVEGLSQLPNLRTLLLANNKLSTAADLQGLTTCSNLKNLDLSSNQLLDAATLELIMALPLALLKLQGNPVVSSTRHYRKLVMSGMPQLNYLDDAPVTDQDRRLAGAFTRGGLEAERSERDVIRQEAVDRAAQQRQAFDDMVAAAKAAPQAPHDPMRFRAMPPGESESDEEGLPASYIVDKQQRRLQMQQEQQEQQEQPDDTAANQQQHCSILPAAESPNAALAARGAPVPAIQRISAAVDQASCSATAPAVESDAAAGQARHGAGSSHLVAPQQTATAHVDGATAKLEISQRTQLDLQATQGQQQSCLNQGNGDEGVSQLAEHQKQPGWSNADGAQPTPAWGGAWYRNLWAQAVQVGEQQEQAVAAAAHGGQQATGLHAAVQHHEASLSGGQQQGNSSILPLPADPSSAAAPQAGTTGEGIALADVHNWTEAGASNIPASIAAYSMADSAMTFEGPDSAVGAASQPGDVQLPHPTAFGAAAQAAPWHRQRTVLDDDDSALLHSMERYTTTSYGHGTGLARRSHDSAMTTGTGSAATGHAAQLRRQDSASMQGPFGDEPEHYRHIAEVHEQQLGAVGASQQPSEPAASDVQGMLDRAEVDSDTLLRQGSNASTSSLAEISTAFLAAAAAAAALPADAVVQGSGSGSGQMRQQQRSLPLEAQDSAMLLSEDLGSLHISQPGMTATQLQPSSAADQPHGMIQPASPTAATASATASANMQSSSALVAPREDSARFTAAGRSVLGTAANNRGATSIAGSDDSAHVVGAATAHYSRHSNQYVLAAPSAVESSLASPDVGHGNSSLAGLVRGPGSADLLAEARRVVLASRSTSGQQGPAILDAPNNDLEGAIAEESYYHSVAGSRHDPNTLAHAREVVLGSGAMQRTTSLGTQGASSSSAAAQAACSSSAAAGPSSIMARQCSGISVGGVTRRGSRGQAVLDAPRERAQFSSLTRLYDLD